MTTFIAIDPGVTSGFVFYDSINRDMVYSGANGTMTIWESWHYGPDPHHFALWEMLMARRPDVVVCEHFLPTPGKAHKEYVSLELIGVVRAWTQMSGRSLYMQTASDAKSFWVNPKLMKLNMKPRNKHEADAMRHLLLCLTKEYKDTTWFDKLK